MGVNFWDKLIRTPNKKNRKTFEDIRPRSSLATLTSRKVCPRGKETAQRVGTRSLISINMKLYYPAPPPPLLPLPLPSPPPPPPPSMRSLLCSNCNPQPPSL
jgi:hypothetical protein